ncbi:MAG: DUF285 domain-containing protein, partial [Candidatus Gracilibacteria bacterium]|nr:DUF285 domain-containing protein [Candidatus Gracilibacteria bacterium]
ETSVNIIIDSNTDSFITTWNTTIDTGVSGFNNIQLPLHDTGTYNFSVDWGDGTSDIITTWNQTETLHNYGTGGIYQVTINGNIDEFGFDIPNMGSTDNQHDGDKLIDINQWGNMLLLGTGGQFSSCENISSFSATDSPEISHITSMEEMFFGATNFNHNIGDWDISNVNDLNSMFWGARSFNQDISSWNTSNVTDFGFLFTYAQLFNQDIGDWNVSKVTNMSQTFYRAESFNQDINDWDISNVVYMPSMFNEAFAFNQPLDKWGDKLTKVQNISGLFFRSSYTGGPDYLSFDQDISNWDTSNISQCVDFSKNPNPDWTPSEKPYFENCSPGYTQVIPDNTAPILNNILPNSEQIEGTNSINLTLDTNEDATCKYDISPDIAYESMGNSFDITGTGSHSTEILGLSDGNTYNYYVRCNDDSGNQNTSDEIVSFSIADNTSPVITDLSNLGAQPSGTTSLEISLNTNEDATCKFDINPDIEYNSMANSFDNTGTGSHSTEISDLLDGETYNYYIKCSDESGNKNTSDEISSFSIDEVIISSGGGGGGGGSSNSSSSNDQEDNTDTAENNTPLDIPKGSGEKSGGNGLKYYHVKHKKLKKLEKKLDKFLKKKKKYYNIIVIQHRNELLKSLDEYIDIIQTDFSQSEKKVNITTLKKRFKIILKDLLNSLSNDTETTDTIVYYHVNNTSFQYLETKIDALIHKHGKQDNESMITARNTFLQNLDEYFTLLDQPKIEKSKIISAKKKFKNSLKDFIKVLKK